MAFRRARPRAKPCACATEYRHRCPCRTLKNKGPSVSTCLQDTEAQGIPPCRICASATANRMVCLGSAALSGSSVCVFGGRLRKSSCTVPTHPTKQPRRRRHCTPSCCSRVAREAVDTTCHCVQPSSRPCDCANSYPLCPPSGKGGCSCPTSPTGTQRNRQARMVVCCTQWSLTAVGTCAHRESHAS